MNPAVKHRQAIVCMVASAALMTSNDALTKLATETLPVGEAIFIRGAICSGLLLPFLMTRHGRQKLRVRKVPLQLTRAVFYAAATIFFLIALTRLPLTAVVTVSFLSPIFVSVFAGFLLGERIGMHRWLAVVAGFAGVVVIVPPSSAVIGIGFGLAVAAAVCDALKDVATRKLIAFDSTLATYAVTMTLTALSGFAVDFGDWQLPTLFAFSLLVLAGLLLATANYLLIEAFRYGEASFVSPFKYSSLIWALLLDGLIWREAPAVESLLGASIILAAGFMAAHVERHGWRW